MPAKRAANKTATRATVAKSAPRRQATRSSRSAPAAPATAAAAPKVGPAKKVAPGKKAGPVSAARRRSTRPADSRADHTAPLWAQRGDRLTGAQGVLIDDTDNSL